VRGSYDRQINLVDDFLKLSSEFSVIGGPADNGGRFIGELVAVKIVLDTNL